MYVEVLDFWKIFMLMIQGWWDLWDKLFEGMGIEVYKVGLGGVLKVLEGWKLLSQCLIF